MKGAITPIGYTIIEVMIVLAVSGVMFLIAANFISGKQESTSFPQGVNELASNLQNTIAQVNNGQYSDISFSCTFAYGASQVSINANGQQTTTNSISGDTQGTNPTCIFLGKVVHFAENDGHAGDIATQQYETFSLAGGRLDGNGQPITADTANPSTPLDNDAPTVIAELTGQSAVPQHLNVIGMHLEPTASEPTTYGGVFPSGPPNYYGIGFIQNLGSTAQPGTQNGAQPIDLYYVSSFTGVISKAAAPSLVNGNFLSPIPSGHEMVMCVTDFTQYAYIEVGSANNQLDVRVRMLGGNPCT
ncbi:MAG TPA: prepilin-type N-terminal cleavage/methylation domain-containing protein [Candidatus Dormibacteraeota bacterium]|nr:prepilin-type N-terminal cleavage/methylation domain-containing protein [Candidatus Dormibacteraeota bacterium]